MTTIGDALRKARIQSDEKNISPMTKLKLPLRPKSDI